MRNSKCGTTVRKYSNLHVQYENNDYNRYFCNFFVIFGQWAAVNRPPSIGRRQFLIKTFVFRLKTSVFRLKQGFRRPKNTIIFAKIIAKLEREPLSCIRKIRKLLRINRILIFAVFGIRIAF